MVSIYAPTEINVCHRLSTSEQRKHARGLSCCGESASWVEPHDAEPDTGTVEWHGGFSCSICCCSYEFRREAPDVDELRDAAAEQEAALLNDLRGELPTRRTP